MPLTPEQLDNWTTYHTSTTDEQLAEALYNSWSHMKGWEPWTPGGNGLKQDEARYAVRGQSTASKYTAIREAEEVMHNAIFSAIYRVREQHNTNPPAYVVDYDSVNAAARAFLIAIDTAAPDSADKQAAFRCVRLARNAANEALTAAAREIDTPIHHWQNADTMEAEAHRQTVLARFQANSAIACGGK